SVTSYGCAGSRHHMVARLHQQYRVRAGQYPAPAGPGRGPRPGGGFYDAHPRHGNIEPRRGERLGSCISLRVIVYASTTRRPNGATTTVQSISTDAGVISRTRP